MSEGAVSEGRGRTVRVIALIAGREIRERLRARSFYLLTGLLVAVILAMGFASRLVGDDEGVTTVGVVEPLPAGFAAALDDVAGAFDRTVEVAPIASAAAAEQAVDDGAVDVAVIGGRAEVTFRRGVDATVQSILQQAWTAASVNDELVEAGLTPDEVAAALSSRPLRAVTLDGDDEPDDLARLTGTMAAVLLFISLQTFGGYVLTGVVEEKSTAVVEVLLARVSADQLLAGKVIGIGVVALTQFAAAIAAGLVSLALSGVDVPGDVWTALPVTLVWFLGGYALYSTLFALAGSLVSRQEDAQAATAPIISVLLAAYVLVFVFGSDPHGRAATVLSLIPPFAPLVMPMRMTTGAASGAEVVVALVLLTAAIGAVWKLAGLIYQQVVLRRGTRISWREALASVRPPRAG